VPGEKQTGEEQRGIFRYGYIPLKYGNGVGYYITKKRESLNAFHLSAWLYRDGPDKLPSTVQVWRTRIPDSWFGNDYPVRIWPAVYRILPEMPGHTDM
jgi:hypothetical protein